MRHNGFEIPGKSQAIQARTKKKTLELETPRDVAGDHDSTEDTMPQGTIGASP